VTSCRRWFSTNEQLTVNILSYNNILLLVRHAYCFAAYQQLQRVDPETSSG